MKTTSEAAADIIALETPEQANDYVADQIVEWREANPKDTRQNEELDALIRSNICAWFSVHNHHQHVRMLKLFRPAWPPVPETKPAAPAPTEAPQPQPESK